MKCEDVGGGLEFADGDEADLQGQDQPLSLWSKSTSVSSGVANYIPIDFLLQNSLFRLLSGDSRLKFEPGLDQYAS